MKNITKLFLNAATNHPNRLAIIDKERSITYAALSKEVKQTAQYFLNEGIKKGDRVLVFVPMSVDLYRIVLALFYIGATAVFLDEWVNKKRLAICCKLADCKGFIGVWKARVFSFFSRELRAIPIKLSLGKKDKNEATLVEMDPNSSALITFTTGSTGLPKAADRTHGFLKEQFDVLIDEIDPQIEDIDMPVLPIVLFVNLGIGCTSVIADFKMTKPDKLDPASILRQINKHGVNRMTASPFFIKKIAQYSIDHKINLDNISKTFTGGAPVFSNEANIYTQAFPNAVNTIVYGSTEVEPISSTNATDLSNNTKEIDRGLYVGQPYHKTQVKVIEITTNSLHNKTTLELEQLTLPANHIGEIIVAGDHVLKQYYKNQKAFEENKILTENELWHRTGDSGFLLDGHLYLTGRAKQLVKHNGQYISPFIIEHRLQSIQDIDQGTILQINEEIILVIVSKLPLDKLKNHCTFIPFDKLITIATMPMDPRHHSKIDYGKLMQMIE